MNEGCPSAAKGGRVLFEHRDGVVFFRQGIRAGEVAELLLVGMPIWAKCPSCGERWTNPSAPLFDEVGKAMRAAAEAGARIARARPRAAA